MARPSRVNPKEFVTAVHRELQRVPCVLPGGSAVRRLRVWRQRMLCILDSTIAKAQSAARLMIGPRAVAWMQRHYGIIF